MLNEEEMKDFRKRQREYIKAAQEYCAEGGFLFGLDEWAHIPSVINRRGSIITSEQAKAA